MNRQAICQNNDFGPNLNCWRPTRTFEILKFHLLIKFSISWKKRTGGGGANVGHCEKIFGFLEGSCARKKYDNLWWMLQRAETWAC